MTADLCCHELTQGALVDPSTSLRTGSGDLVFASGRWLDVGSYIDHLVRVEVESPSTELRINSGIVALGMCGLLFDAEAVAFSVELPVGFLERDSAIFKHKLDIALAALSVQPLHSAQDRLPNIQTQLPSSPRLLYEPPP